MAKKSILQRELLKEKLVNKFLIKRKYILKQLKKVNKLNILFLLYKKIQKLPKNSNKIRLRNRCWKTGKARGYYSFFGLCRNIIKNSAYNCILPGLIKSSW
jgi:small subunit ribosomal protein S14